mmetsp:Transcript_23656/g.56109  ORF Transcript_23656/g.56109 Transcript_23656/m.56109 type:complete len:105 (-) Transcript_23656:105-419(-)
MARLLLCLAVTLSLGAADFSALVKDDECQDAACSSDFLQKMATEEKSSCATCHLSCLTMPFDRSECTSNQYGLYCEDPKIAKACPRTCGCCTSCSICKIPRSCY